ncbi:MAG: LutB/LldF family L-lactate oxidation iron-sulfur protein [Microscillaceae bacterium]|jgi:L-lactate dehydrogenase complex protein LldF|nr:LutB/LldF family L-lactate oxidation iron-sulfur protein [Microscillaceae bacterium]
MPTTEHSFTTTAENKAFDQKHRHTINNNIDKYNTAVQRGLHQYQDHDLARSRAAYIKTQTIEHLDQYLLEFEQNFVKRGGKVIWAETAADALREVWAIFQAKKARMVVKSKSMTTEEIGLNEYLEARGIENVETDLGEYIVQLAHQKPYHIVTPAMHLSRQDVSQIFTEKLGVPPTDDATELTLTCRRMLRQKYTEAEIGITGGNFLIADVGGVAVTENEGNARLSTTFPKTHIAIVGIEKIIPKLQDLDLFWSLLATSGTGQRLTIYNSVYSGARQAEEPDGPEEMYVILLDNGRTELLADAQKRQSLNCIRCGACLNACPVYKNIGGHSYQTTYSGPIGSVISPHYNGMKEFKHLSYASSLCGACGSVCPVKIDLPLLLLQNRAQSVNEGLNTTVEKIGFQLWRRTMLKRHRLNRWSGRVKNYIFQRFFKGTWGKRRALPVVAPQSFNEMWRAKMKKKS